MTMLAQHMDHGIHNQPFYKSFCIRAESLPSLLIRSGLIQYTLQFPCCSNQVSPILSVVNVTHKELTLISWRWAYGIGSIYGAIVVFLIAVFMEETLVAPYSLRYIFSCPHSIYDRTVKPIPARPSTGLRYRIETLVRTFNILHRAIQTAF
jgi:hypothetical protein